MISNAFPDDAIRGRQAGTTLIEVLVAMVLLALALLGTSALQSSAQRSELDAYQRSQALILTQDMLNRISANRRAARCYETYPETGTGVNFIGTGNDPTPCMGWGNAATRARADDDLAHWNALLEGAAETLNGNNVGSMTGARGCIEHRFDDVNGDGNEEDLYIVTVAWQGQNPTQAPAANDCAEDEFGDEALRRVVSLNLRMGRLN